MDTMRRLASLTLVFVAAMSADARASVLVVSNRTEKPVALRLASLTSAAGQLTPTVDAGDSLPLPLDGIGRLGFMSAGNPKTYRVQSGGVYYLHEVDENQLELGRIGLSTPVVRKGEKSSNTVGQPPDAVVVPVKVLYDDAEVATHARWEARIRERFEHASAILRKHCFVEFHVVAVDRWKSDEPRATSLGAALKEFEQVVDPAPGHLAIGFTGRQATQFDRAFSGARGPLHSHLLLRESHEKTDHEQLEQLVHALAHYLGAAHSPENHSVMRTKLNDHQARSAGHRIVFDPLNTMAMCLVSEELRGDPRLHFGDVSAAARDELQRIYVELARLDRRDKTAAAYLRRLGQN